MLLSTILFIMIGGVASLDMGSARAFIIEPVSNAISRIKRQATSEPAKLPTMKDMLITSNVDSRFATVKIASFMVNEHDESLEATFSVQIPETAFIANFTMIINDTVLVAQVYEKKVAQEKYDKAKEQGQTAGQIKHVERNVARGMDIFNTNVNVAARDDVYFEITYQELLDRRLGLYTQRIVVQPMQIVDNLTMMMSYNEPQSFSSFSFKEPNSTVSRTASTTISQLKAGVDTKQIVFKPSTADQARINSKTGIDGEFVVTYDVGHTFDGGNIVYAVENPYFIHYFAVDKSEDLSAIPKNIMFVVDISGSMGGRKIEQANLAVRTIIPQLQEFDFFNILLFDDRQVFWRSYPSRATQENIRKAVDFARTGIVATGGTNINDALIQSITSVANDRDLASRAGIIIFLTDGQPTSGVTGLKSIRNNIKRINENRVALFTLGFGAGVDFDFLQEISWENGGFARRIYEESDAATQLVDFFKEIKDPVLKDVNIVYPSNEVELVTRTNYKQYFSGKEIVVAGKRQGNSIDATVTGNTATNTINLVVPASSKKEIQGQDGEFTEKLWAYLRIKDLLRMKAIAETEEEAEAYEKKALVLSLKYSFVTPLTSLVVVQEQPGLQDESGFFSKSAGGMNSNVFYSETSGASSNVMSVMSLITSLIMFMIVFTSYW